MIMYVYDISWSAASLGVYVINVGASELWLVERLE